MAIGFFDYTLAGLMPCIFLSSLRNYEDRAWFTFHSGWFCGPWLWILVVAAWPRCSELWSLDWLWASNWDVDLSIKPVLIV